MTSLTSNPEKPNKGRGPLRVYYAPTPTSTQPLLTINKSSISLPKTYWTESEDEISIMSSFSEDSSSSSTTSLPRYACPSTFKQTSRMSNSSLQQYFPTILGVKRTSGHLQLQGSERRQIKCSCCCPSTPTKRPLVAMGARGLMALRGSSLANQSPMIVPPSQSSQYLAPVCPVPMLPPYLSRPNLLQSTSPILRSIETQTSPSEDDKKNVRRSRSQRSSGALLNSLKRKLDHIRRSVSSDRAGTRAPSRKASGPSTLERRGDEVTGVTKCTLLQRFADGSRLVQMRRQSTKDQFGLFIKVGAKGLYINRLNNVEFTNGGSSYLRAGDRVLEVQNVPAKRLDTDAVRGLLQGCQIAILKVQSTTR